MTYSGTEAWLTLVGNKTLDSDLVFIPKWSLVNATADKFAKQIGVNINNNYGQTKINTKENTMNKAKT